jgi:hypothetical protein
MALKKNTKREEQFNIIDEWLEDFDRRFVESGWKSMQMGHIRPNVVDTIDALRRNPNAQDIDVTVTDEGALDIQLTYNAGRRIFQKEGYSNYSSTQEQFRGTDYEVPMGFRIDPFGAVLVGDQRDMVLSPGVRYDYKERGYQRVGGRDIFNAMEEAVNKGGFLYQQAQAEARTQSGGSGIFVDPIYDLDEADPLVNIRSIYRKNLVDQYGAQRVGSDLEQMAMAFPGHRCMTWRARSRPTACILNAITMVCHKLTPLNINY